MTWKRSIVAADRTHHLLDGRPLYVRRFNGVQKFHEPGLAPVVDESGAFHITQEGTPAYSTRFRITWGFYACRAAVADATGWFHILPDGSPLSAQRYAWCGNFQDGYCAVRAVDGRYFHLDETGAPAYPGSYLYVGDFRDGAAVVRCPVRKLCTHIGADGRALHAGWFLDLDVFHKGFARARDEAGWFHIRADGTAAYKERFAAVEPFYNGSALAETRTGDRVLVDQAGHPVLVIANAPVLTAPRSPNVKIVVVGNIGAGKSEVCARLAGHLGWRHVAIDGLRRRFSDGTPAGELLAWAQLVREAQAAGPRVLEFSGLGPMLYLVKRALADSDAAVVVLWVDAPVEVCLRRLAGRCWDIPYPDFGVPLESVVRDLGRRLADEVGAGRAWSNYVTEIIDGQLPRDEVGTTAVRVVTDWLRERAL